MPDTSAQFQPNLQFVKRFLIKVSSTKFHKNSLSWRHASTFRHTNRQMDVTKLTDTVCYYVNMNKKKHTTIILLVVSCRCEIWSFKEWEETRLRVFKNRALSKMF